MQYGNDMSMGILSGFAHELDVPYYEDGYGSAAYQNGRFGGQIGSTVTGVYLLVDGVWKIVEGAALVGAGGGSEILSGSSSSVVSIPTIGVGVGVVVVGGAEAGYGFGILRNNFSDPVSYAKGSSGHTPLRGRAAKKAAAELGYTKRIPAQKAPFNSHGQPVFQKPGTNSYITPDVDMHKGGVWKQFTGSGNNWTRATYNADLTVQID
jgi:hypothetical protein